MKRHVVTIPEVGLIALTRAMLGAGIAFLVCDKLAPEHRRAIGWTLGMGNGVAIYIFDI